MLRIVFLLMACTLCVTMVYSQVKVGDNPLVIDDASLIEIESTSKGFLPSRMTTAQRDLQTSWEVGHIIYNLTESCLEIYNGTSWECFVKGVLIDSTIYKYDGSLISDRLVDLDGNNIHFKPTGQNGLFVQGDGDVGIGTTSPNAKLDVENGTVRLSDYGAGAIGGTADYVLGVDSDGDVIEIGINTVGTDDQKIDTFALVGNELRISSESDNEPFKSVNLGSFLDNTDDQTIDSILIRNDSLLISLESDGEDFQGVDLSSYLNTDDQTASEVSFTPSGTITSTDVQAAIEELDPDVYGTIDVHSDVDITTVAPMSGDILAWDGLNFVPQSTNNGYTIFGVWAEESAALGTDTYEWAFGNGDDTPNGNGVVIPMDCELFAMSLNHEGGINTTVRIVKNAIDTMSSYEVVLSGVEQGYNTFGVPLSFTAGDLVNFKTISSSSSGTSGRAAAWFRIRATPASTSLVNDLLDVSAGGITSNQILIFDGSSFVPLTLNAQNISYDNSTSGLTAVTIQEAIDEINLSNTDDQTIDSILIRNDSLLISLENDGEDFQGVDLSPYAIDSSIYKFNGTLSEARTLTLGGYNLTFSGTNNVTFESTGELGLGESSPNAPLHITETTGTPASAVDGSLILQHNDSGGSSSLVFKSASNVGSDYGYIQFDDDGSGNGSSTENALLTIGIQNDVAGSLVDDIAIMPSGNLGIGTTSPAARLDVDGGNVRFSTYGGGSIGLNTQQFLLGVDTDGDVVEVAASTIGSDNQTIDSFALNGNILTLSLEDDGVAPLTVDLSTISGSSTNIYNTSDSLESARVVTLNNFDLIFDGTTDADVIIQADGDVGIGTLTPSGDFQAISDENQNAFSFIQENVTTGERDVFTIQDQDIGSGTQDESSVLKVHKSGAINSGDLGFSLIELANTGTDPGASKYWISGRKTDEGAPLWGVDITDNDYWSEGGIILGVTGADGGTYSGGTFRVEEATGNTAIGHVTPNSPLHIIESTGTPASATDATVILEHSDSGGSSSIVFKSQVNSGSDYGFIQFSDDGSGNGSTSENALLTIGTQNDGIGANQDDIAIMPSGNLGVGTTSPAAKLDVDGGSVRFSDYGAGTYADTSATYLLATDAQGDVVELNTAKNTRWFYAPAVTINASDTVTNAMLDLYQEYVDQFSSPQVSSAGAPTSLPIYDANELWYYVTYSDDTVIDNISINASGVMTYDIIDVPFDNFTIVNIIFLIK